MYKIKTSYYYLERGFPENLEPAFTNQSTKRKRFLVERKKKILKRVIRKSLRTLVKPFFSEPTKNGVLLEKSEGFFQDVVAQVKKENSQRKGFVFGVNDAFCKIKNHGVADLFHEMKNKGVGIGVFPPCEKTPIPTPTPTKQNEKIKSSETRRESEKKTAEQAQEIKQETTFSLSEKKNKQKKYRRYKFLFPLHRLKGELSKRESQYGKIELYKKQIQERKKLSLIYGTISKNSMKKLVKQAHILSSGENPPARVLVTLLESRLDVALYRASLFPSVHMSRQWVSHNKVKVNQNQIRAPGYQLKGGDCIEISPTCAFLVKEKMRQRITKILPFRRSRKKVVTPSLMERLCSFETLFSKEKSPIQRMETRSLQSILRCNRISLERNAVTTQNGLQGDDFFFDRVKEDQKTGNTCFQNLSIKGDQILINSALMQNFSSMKDHLQSIWERSVCSQQFFSNKPGARRIKNKNHPYQTLPSLLRRSSSSQVSTLSAKRNHKKDQMRIIDRKPQKNRTPIRKANKNSTKMSFLLQKGVILFRRLRKKEVSTLDFLNAKKALIQPRNRAQKLAGFQVSATKPLHLEVSYRLLTVIFLYSPQKVAYSCHLDFSLIMKSFK